MRPLRTVHALLEERGALALLDDPLMEAATAEIVAAGVPRHEVQKRIKVGGGWWRGGVGWGGGRARRTGCRLALSRRCPAARSRPALFPPRLTGPPTRATHPTHPITCPPLRSCLQVKERAREQLSRKYRSRGLSEEEILHCLYSISDNNSYLLFNRDPIDR